MSVEVQTERSSMPTSGWRELLASKLAARAQERPDDKWARRLLHSQAERDEPARVFSRMAFMEEHR